MMRFITFLVLSLTMQVISAQNAVTFSAENGSLQKLQGNWVEASANQWEYGLYEQFAIYQSDFWKYKTITAQQGKIEIDLENDGRIAHLTIVQTSDSLLTIKDGKRTKKYIRQSKGAHPYPKADKKTRLPLAGLRADTAIVRGCLFGFGSVKDEWGKHRAGNQIYCGVNILGGVQKIYSSPVDSFGRFEWKIPLLTTQDIYVDWGWITLVPGEVTMVYADVNDLIYRGENIESAYREFYKRPKDIIFMGEYARLHNESLFFPLSWSTSENWAGKSKTDMDFLQLMQNDYQQGTALFEKEVSSLPTVSSATTEWMRTRNLCNFGNLLMQHRQDIYNKGRAKFDSPAYVDYIQKQMPFEDAIKYLAFPSFRSFIENYIGYFQDINSEIKVTPTSVTKTSYGRSFVPEKNQGDIDPDVLKLKNRLFLIDSLFQKPTMKDVLVAEECIKEMNRESLPYKDKVMEYLKGRMTTSVLYQQIEQLNNQFIEDEKNGYLHEASLQDSEILKSCRSAEEIWQKLLSPHKGRFVCVDIWNGNSYQAPLLNQMKTAREGIGMQGNESVDFVYLISDDFTDKEWKSYIKRSGYSGESVMHYRLPGAQMGLLSRDIKLRAYPVRLLFDEKGQLKKRSEGTINCIETTQQLASMRQMASSQCAISENGKTAKVADVVIPEDILIPPSGGYASESERGYGIEKTFDRSFDAESHFHSPWNNQTKMPVVMEFFFDGNSRLPERIDYVTYYSRSGNGNFGKFNLYVSTGQKSDYTLYGQYDFGMSSQPSVVTFKGGLKHVKKIKFEVLNGLSGYVSCSEMEFRCINTDRQIEKQLLEVFTDLSCSQLKKQVSQSRIDALPPYFSIIAAKLQKGNYEKDFRIHDYPAYSDPDVWSEKLITAKYGRLDNTTGIYADGGEEIFVLVGDTHGQKISLMSVEDGVPYGDFYPLHSGINKLKITKAGILYVMYHTDITAPNALPVRIHIPMGSGVVNGYFDLEEHQTNEKYAKLLKKATWKYFNIKGKNIMMTLHVARLREFVPDSILPTLKLWDQVADWNFELMGLEDIRPKQMNNRLYAMSNEQGYMSATDYFTQFHENTLYKILVPETMLAEKDNMWGPAHEIGHINQGAINWKGCQESTNNLFANYVTYKLGKFATRGSALTEMNRLRLRNNTPFVLFEPQYQGENTEMHVRMNWQLFTYFHRIGIQPHFFPDLFKLLRSYPCKIEEPGKGQLNFVKWACVAARLDLTDFFDFWGFFLPVNQEIEQYGHWNYVVTQEAIDETKRWIKQQNYPKPAHAIQYIEERNQNDRGNADSVGDVGKWIQFRDNQLITKKVTYTKQNEMIRIQNGNEAVAFEIRDGGKLCYFSNFLQFKLPVDLWKDGMAIYAVQADGKRIPLSAESI